MLTLRCLCLAIAAIDFIEIATSSDPQRVAGEFSARTIVYLHVWKCGGTNFCAWAIRNGENVPKVDHRNPHDRCGAQFGGVATDDGRHLLRALSGNFSLVTWQAPLPIVAQGSQQLRKVALVVALRKPVDQALSHYSHVQHIRRSFSNLTAFVEYGLCLGAWPDSHEKLMMERSGHLDGPCGTHLVSSFPVSPHTGKVTPFVSFRDNQQLRWLQGLDTLSIAPRPVVRAANLEKAKIHLDRFEVLMLDKLHIRDRFRLAKYGWRDLNDRPISVDVTSEEKRPLKEVTDLRQQPHVLAWLKQIQRWDLKLYAHASKLARRQAAMTTKGRLEL